MKTKYKSHTTAIAVIPEGESIFTDSGMVVLIEDEGAGPYVVLTDNASVSRIEIEPEMWLELKNKIDFMMEVCEELEVKDEKITEKGLI